jgi:probable F420-dependent oxidoreductase
MRFGITSPVLQTVPGVSDLRGDEVGGVDDLRHLLSSVERLGYDHATFPEHVAVPVNDTNRIGGVWWGQLPALGFAACMTTRIRLVSYVTVLGYHHPVEIVKSFGTVDVLSGGRLVLGVGVGSLKPEFDLLGAEFEGRGQYADQSLETIRRLWGRPTALEGFIVQPCGTSTHVPVWVGGRSRRSFERAVKHGDGWTPFALTLEEISAYLASVELPDDFEVVMGTTPALDPLNDPGATEAAIARYEAAGVTGLAMRFVHQSLSHYHEQLDAFAALVGLTARV